MTGAFQWSCTNHSVDHGFCPNRCAMGRRPRAPVPSVTTSAQHRSGPKLLTNHVRTRDRIRGRLLLFLRDFAYQVGRQRAITALVK
ncbi:hypothetical protein CDAR_278561 [Caerostris darwini]|uniref:Uncharacterized protein n=1 Tax=Caerostris darwini TaxID=1538125 RepID=A0AAV4WS83_9ARAC|nr:hypothetical protein CDAR_278561 [Caerostris darwini]